MCYNRKRIAIIKAKTTLHNHYIYKMLHSGPRLILGFSTLGRKGILCVCKYSLNHKKPAFGVLGEREREREMVRLTADLIWKSPHFFNALGERELDLRGLPFSSLSLSLCVSILTYKTCIFISMYILLY